MKVREYYDLVEGDYEDAMERFLDESRIKKYLLKLPSSLCFKQLCESMEKKDYDEAFKAVHSMKGVTANMSLKKIYDLTVLLTEELRDGKCGENKDIYYEELKLRYEKALSLIPEVE